MTTIDGELTECELRLLRFIKMRGGQVVSDEVTEAVLRRRSRYTARRRLEERGLIRLGVSVRKPRSKVYVLTELGQAVQA